jgi:hypothetical protein
MLGGVTNSSITKHELSSKYQDRTYFKGCLSKARNLDELWQAGLDVRLHAELLRKLRRT